LFSVKKVASYLLRYKKRPSHMEEGLVVYALGSGYLSVKRRSSGRGSVMMLSLEFLNKCLYHNWFDFSKNF
jgi:hypothetical protein